MIPPPLSRRTTFLASALAVAAVHAWLIAIGVNPVRSGGRWDQLWDPDSYTRLSRVLELARTWEWYDPRFQGGNFPDGFVLHWTRLLDLLLYVPARVGAAFIPFERALLGWGIALAPLLHLGAVLLLVASARHFLGRGILILLALLVTQRGITYDFLPGFVDHHPLQLLALLAAIALLLRPSGRSREAAVAGLVMAFGVWASAESTVIVAGLALGLASDWVLSGDASAARRLAAFGAGATLSAAALLPIERPLGALLAPSYDRFSVVQVTLLACVAAVGAAAAWAATRSAGGSVGRRLLLVAVASGVAGGVTLLLFPALARHPYATTASVIRESFLPSLASENRFLPTDAGRAYDFVLEIAPGLAVVAWAAWRLTRGDAGREERSRLVVTGAATLAFAGYAVYAYRGLPFVSAACAVPWAEALTRLLRWSRGTPGSARRAARLALAGATAAGHWLLAAAIALAWMPSFGWRNSPECRWDLLVEAVPRLASPGGSVLTDVFSGPEVHYRTGRPVIGSPYHENGAGMEATLRLFAAPPEESGAELARRRVDWIAICGARTGEVLATRPGGAWGLGNRLVMGLPPAAFARVALPAGLDGQFLLHVRTSP